MYDLQEALAHDPEPQHVFLLLAYPTLTLGKIRAERIADDHVEYRQVADLNRWSLEHIQAARDLGAEGLMADWLLAQSLWFSSSFGTNWEDVLMAYERAMEAIPDQMPMNMPEAHIQGSILQQYTDVLLSDIHRREAHVELDDFYERYKELSDQVLERVRSVIECFPAAEADP